jgi:glycogen operon protein
MVEKAMWHIRSNHNDHAVVNYIVGHDGFTLNDLVSYNYRHNEENGEENRDGSSYNYSWNCGVEGPTRKQSVKRIRERQMRNAIFMLLLSQGVPLLYGGDEIGNSQEGNNNAWCQDNPIGWIDWKGLKKNEALLKFVKKAIAFRKAHPILHTAKEMKESDYLAKGFPDISFHGERAWYVNRENTSRLFGVMYYGAYSGREETGQTPAQEDFVYVAYNFHWEKRSLALPNLPEGLCWEKIADTGETAPEGCFYEKGRIYHKSVETGPRTIVVLVGRQEEKK